jgi:beta-glucosidase
MSFKSDFIWGASAASYQIEGAAYEDGKGLSVWDVYCRQPGKIHNDDTGDVSCDHYHRYPEDIGIMKEIGLKGYRLSVSWPRIIPSGSGAVNQKGLDFYDKLIDGLLAAGIEPWITLFHWDYPHELFCKGGWLNTDSPAWFADYVKVVIEKLSDRVTHWITMNEPQCFIGLGHVKGFHTPGLKLGAHEALRARRNTLLAHGEAVQIIRASASKPPTVGWAPVVPVSYPATNSAEYIEAARKSTFSLMLEPLPAEPLNPFWSNTLWADPIVLGKEPCDWSRAFDSSMPQLGEEDLKTIAQPLDFYGANIYQGQAVKAGSDGSPEKVPQYPGFPLTAFKWAVTPESLYWGPRFIHERYKLPIVITENGLSGADWVSLDGRVHDYHRIDFLHRYLLQLRCAARDGVDVRGYFQWSIMDNFEWGEGYRERFGLVHIDYQTGKRTLKDSAYWYRDVIASNGDKLGIA